MKSASLTIAIVITLISCSSLDESKKIDYTGYADKEILLTGYGDKYEWNDSLASISLKIPGRLDTFYKWLHETCNIASGWMKYRFADRSYPQLAENGWFELTVPDSAYQFNIWHKPIRIPPDLIDIKPLRKKDTAGWYYHPHIVCSSKQTNFLLKEFRSINERSFIISAFVTSWGYFTRSQTLYIIAETNLKSRELYFIGECAAKDTTGFIEAMYKTFLSIKIDEKQ